MNKITNIIVEGADQQGKTMICERFSRILGWKVLHFPPPPEDFDFHEDYILPPFMISDRNFMSEIVYRSLENRPYRLVDQIVLQEKMADNTIFILVDRGEHFKFQNRDELFTEEQIQEARMLYSTFFSSVRLEKYRLNPNSSDLGDKFKEILKRIE